MHPGLYLISTFHYLGSSIMMIKRVNALSGLYIISTKKERFWGCRKVNVSMPFRAYTSFLHEIRPTKLSEVVGCQCPLGLIPHFYVPLQKPRFYAVSRACFCRYLSEYSDNSRFSCMLTFWTYLMRCTYP